MRPTTPAAHRSSAFRLAVALAALLAAGSAAAQRDSGAAALYRSERAACLAGQSHQDRATCLKEAAAAQAEARRGRLGNGRDPAEYQRNALARCDLQPAAERDACRAMVRGEGTTRGSVEQGGVVRELVTREPAASAPAR